MSEPSQEAILAALQSQTSFRARNPPNTSTYADLADPAELTKTSGDALVNSRKLYCPRAGCSCVIIGAGAATYIEAKADIVRTISLIRLIDLSYLGKKDHHLRLPRPKDISTLPAPHSRLTTLDFQNLIRRPRSQLMRLASRMPRAKSSGSSVPNAISDLLAGASRAQTKRGLPWIG